MGIFEAIILGIVQGATEYLPVSSSGHLVLVPFVFGFQKGTFSFDILVQLGTLLAVLVYYAKDLWAITRHVFVDLKAGKPFRTVESKLGWYVVVASIPAGIIGILFKDDFEKAFSSPQFTMGMLVVTATLLLLGEWLGKRNRQQVHMRLVDAVFIGLAQALALFPGVSRSGSTISAAMLLGLDRETAARFSFVMSIPVMLGAGLLAFKDLLEHPAELQAQWLPILVGFIVSALTGFVAIKWFLGYVKNRSLKWFALYCLLVGAGGLIYFEAFAP